MIILLLSMGFAKIDIKDDCNYAYKDWLYLDKKYKDHLESQIC